jgi:hypothetical protein
MLQQPELMNMSVEERQRPSGRVERATAGQADHPAGARRVPAPPVGHRAYYRGIAVAVWRAALRPRAVPAYLGCPD